MRLHYERFNCECLEKQLRKRVIKGGAIQYVYQCQRCGDVSLQAVGRAKAFEISGGKEPPPLDTSLREAWKRTEQEEREKVRTRTNENFWVGYSSYLGSAEWAEKRRLIFKRANGVCEGCGTRPPSQVHHLTYEHVGSEFLFELVAVCGPCHERLHPEEHVEQIDVDDEEDFY